MTIAQAQIETRTDFVVLAPLKSMDEALEQEFKKGEVTGMRTILSLTKDELEDSEAEIQQILEKMEEDKANDAKKVVD